MEKSKPYHFWIDVGGTFTDCVALFPDGSLHIHKLLSSSVTLGKVGEGSSRREIVDNARKKDPEQYYRGFTLSLAGEERQVVDFSQGRLKLDKPLSQAPVRGESYELSSQEEAPLLGARYLVKKLPPDSLMLLGTTRGTNAFLERKGAKTAFLTTKGFADLLKIGTQQRPKLFELNIEKPDVLYSAVIEVQERIDADGRIVQRLDEEEVRQKLQELKGVEALAVCLLFSYKNGVHEKQIGKMAKERGFKQISLSSDLVPIEKMLPRSDTTVIDAYLTPVIRDYVSRLSDVKLQLMTSAGGLVSAEHFVGKDSLFSGPAGGVVGSAQVALSAGFEKVIGFDMGGTSTDVSRYDGSFEYLFEEEFEGKQLLSPMLHIETVAAGGGSICWYDGQMPRVGPESAGADPGPACYGKGGPLTLTDLNVFLGRVLPEHFPFPLDLEAVTLRLDALLQRMPGISREKLAMGFLNIANEKMAAAIKRISLQRGYDPRDYVLNCFGGAAAQHGCAIAEQLGMTQILVHPFASVLSAFGMGCADIKLFSEQMLNCPLGELEQFEAKLREAEQKLTEKLATQGEFTHLEVTRLFEMRYVGQDWTLTIPEPASKDFKEAFEALHKQRYGFIYPEHPLEVAAVRLEGVGCKEKYVPKPLPLEEKEISTDSTTLCYLHDRWVKTPHFARDALKAGNRVRGPALITERYSAIVVEPGWSVEVDAYLNCILTQQKIKTKTISAALDPINLELFHHKFTSIAEQMGVTLKKTALSVNVKERMDFSCALFTPTGDLVVNAPHIPVHLGGMSECIKCLIQDVPTMHPGDVFITNDPLRGGSHIPDVTVITPVFDKGKRVFFTASRAHHAEIGGITPGSMPPFAKNLAEEGVLLRNFLFRPGDPESEEQLKKHFTDAPYPTRALEDNLADIHAAVSANYLGAQKLQELVSTYTLEVVHAYMGYIQRAAKNKMEEALQKIPAGTYTFEDQMDNGAKIVVAITLEGKCATIDFTGTDPVVPNNFNAPPSIVTSCLMYCFRCLIDEEIPLNAGILEPLHVVLPENCLLNPTMHKDPLECPAVGAGNVETSQRIVDVIFGALKKVAASQGTMNNFLFGGAGFAYYETLGGGSGAGRGFGGADAVHTHMTNTRLTDPEVIESRFPVRIRRFAIRKGSGGEGEFSGGDGLIREVEFLDELEVSLITDRRVLSPYGLNGGAPGKPGQNALNGKILPPSSSFRSKAGDILTIETPGGGGWGSTKTE